MKKENKKGLSRENAQRLLSAYNPEQEELECFSSEEVAKMKVFYEEFKKQKQNLIDFIKDIRNFTRKDQADALKRNYGTRSIKSKIAFRILDSVCEERLNEQEEIDLFIFCSKFLT
jgi:hypothetical protein